MDFFSDLAPHLLSGLVVTLKVYTGAAVFVVVVGFAIGLLRCSRPRPLRWGAMAYIQVFRGLPVLVLLFWFYFVLPAFHIDLGAFTVGVLALGLNYAAYAAEIVRGAVQSIPKTQWEAAQSLNMTTIQCLRHVILPQAIVRMLPPIGNLHVELLKNTALVMFVGIADIAYQSRVLQNSTQRTIEIFGASLVLYFVVALLIVFVARRLERILSRGLRAGGGHAA